MLSRQRLRARREYDSNYAGGGGAPYMVVASKHGKAILRRDFPTRESKDSRMHVCLGQYDTGEKEVMCLFIPPGT